MKKINCSLIIVYIVAISLIISYFYILYHGLRPKEASLDYQKYYVEDVLQDWPGYGGLDYKIGDVEYFSCNYDENIMDTRGIGWGQLESEGCWTVGEEAYFYENIVNAQ